MKLLKNIAFNNKYERALRYNTNNGYQIHSQMFFILKIEGQMIFSININKTKSKHFIMTNFSNIIHTKHLRHFSNYHHEINNKF